MKKILLIAILAMTCHLVFGQFKTLPKTNSPGNGQNHHPSSGLVPILPAVPAGSRFPVQSKTFTPIASVPKPVSGNSQLMAFIDEQTGCPYSIQGTVKSEGANDREKLDHYLNQTYQAFKMTDPFTEIEIEDVSVDKLGFKHYRLHQSWKGVSVFGAEAVLHEKDGTSYLFQGHLFPTPELQSEQPEINGDEALHLAIDDLRQFENLKELTPLEKELAAYQGPTTELVVYFAEGKPGSEILAWHIQVVPNLASKYEYFIDSRNGQVINKFNSICTIDGSHNVHGTDKNSSISKNLHLLSPPPDGPAIANATDLHGNIQTINTYQKSNLYYLIDASRPMFKPAQSNIPDDPVGVIITLDALNTSPASNNFQAAYLTSSNNSWNNPKAVSAHYNGGKAYEYYKNTFGRESINGEGGNIISLINVVDENGAQMDNAFWSGAAMFYGNGNQGFVSPLCKALDVAGHELSHGVIQSTANLLYQNESGALNESFADIFGAMIDRDDWQLGEEVVNTSVFPSGALRDMSNPHNGGTSLSDNGWQPAHYSERFTGNEDNGGVHTNSGIINKAFFNFATDPSVGKDKAEQVFYRALTVYLFKSAQFIDCRVAVVQAANDLFGSTVASAAETAFTAVGIGSGGGTNSQTNIEINPGEDFVLLTDDNFSQLYIFAPDGSAVANPLTTTSPLSRPSVTDDGSVAVFIASDNTMRALTIDWNNSQVDEQVLSSDQIWRNVAISRDGARIAALTTDYDNLLWVYDFTLQQWQSYELYNPTTGQGGPISGDVQYADVIEWDYAGEWVMYDALNGIPTTGSNDIDYWDVSFINVWDNTSGFFADGFTDKLFSLLPQDVSVGNPTFSKNSDYIISLDYFDEFNNVYFILGANVETGDVGTIFENSDLSWPNFSVDDQFLVFDAFNTGGTPVLAFIQLANNKITAAADPFVFVEQGRRGVWFANGERVLVNSKEAVQGAELTVYPNPVGDVLNIELPNYKGQVALTITDVSGRIVRNIDLTDNSNKYTLPVDDLESGLYLLTVKNSSFLKSLKFYKN